MDDPYRILGVPSGASPQRITKAYRRLAFRHHPDRNPGREAEAAERFRAVVAAYETLCDPVARASWDRRRAGGSAATRSRPPAPRRPAPRPSPAAGPAPPAAAEKRRRPFVVRAVAAVGAFGFGVTLRLVGGLLLAVGGPSFAASAERARHRRLLESLPGFVRVLIRLARGTAWAAFAGYVVMSRIARGSFANDADFADARRVVLATLVVAGVILLAERVFAAVAWALRADRAEPFRGAR